MAFPSEQQTAALKWLLGFKDATEIVLRCEPPSLRFMSSLISDVPLNCERRLSSLVLILSKSWVPVGG